MPPHCLIFFLTFPCFLLVYHLTNEHCMTTSAQNLPPAITLSENDVIAAMKEIQGYIDITPGDFQEIFHIAYQHALHRIRTSLQAKDIMSKPVFCLSLDTEVTVAARLLADQAFSGAPVLDADGKIAGVLSEKDLLSHVGMDGHSSFLQVIAQCMENKGCMAAALRGKSVEEIMSSPAISARPETSIGEISLLFTEKKINRVPIIDTDNQPIGMVTRNNLVQSYCLFNER